MNRFFVFAFGAASLTVLFLAITPSPEIPGNPNDKLLHAIAFVVLALLAALAFPRVKLRYLAILLAGFAASIEMIQLMMQQGRVAEWYDFTVSAVGAAVVLFLVFLVRRSAVLPKPQ